MKILVLTGDPITPKMSGPAIRAWNICLQLSEIHEVQLVSFSPVEICGEGFSVIRIKPNNFSEIKFLEQWADVILVQGYVLAVYPMLMRTKKILVVDLYDPIHLENLEQSKSLPHKEWSISVKSAVSTLNFQLARGDFFICASEQQRDLWLGQLSALGRVNPENYSNDNTLRNLIDVVPFGISLNPPLRSSSPIKGAIKGIGKKDKVIIWSGGIYDWFDPITLIKAVKILSGKRPNVRLFFLGTQHPHPDVPEMPIVSEARQLAEKMNILNQFVFFNEDWVDFGDRQNYLLDSDLGVSTHHDHIETRFSFRTRILDYIWADLPIVTSEGDFFAKLVTSNHLGLSVPCGDELALSNAIEVLLYNQQKATQVILNITNIKSDFFWQNTVIPLVAFCNNPRHSQDFEASLKFIKQNRKFLFQNYPRLGRLSVSISVSKSIIKQYGLFAFLKKLLRKIGNFFG